MIHERLGEARFISLIVSVAPIADQVNDKVFVEPLPIRNSRTDRFDAGFRFVRIDMDDWDFNPLARSLA